MRSSELIVDGPKELGCREIHKWSRPSSCLHVTLSKGLVADGSLVFAHVPPHITFSPTLSFQYGNVIRPLTDGTLPSRTFSLARLNQCLALTYSGLERMRKTSSSSGRPICQSDIMMYLSVKDALRVHEVVEIFSTECAVLVLYVATVESGF